MTLPKRSGAHGIQVSQWLSWADEDYLAARALLLHAYLRQGAALANTAIEKYLKAALVARKATFRNTHDVKALYDLLARSGQTTPVNAAFLTDVAKRTSSDTPMTCQRASTYPWRK